MERLDFIKEEILNDMNKLEDLNYDCNYMGEVEKLFTELQEIFEPFEKEFVDDGDYGNNKISYNILKNVREFYDRWK